MESVTRRITSARLDGSTVLVLLLQFVCDAWALECRCSFLILCFGLITNIIIIIIIIIIIRVCDGCANMFSARDAVQVMAAADQVDEQLLACASALKVRLEEECR